MRKLFDLLPEHLRRQPVTRTTGSDIDGLWYVKVSGPGYPAVLITVGNATDLVVHLRHALVQDLADRFQEQADRARRFAGNVE